jgi:hypothetical protein
MHPYPCNQRCYCTDHWRNEFLVHSPLITVRYYIYEGMGDTSIMSERSHTDEKYLDPDVDLAIAQKKLLPGIEDLSPCPMEMIQRRLRVLIVEDNNADACLVQALVE